MSGNRRCEDCKVPEIHFKRKKLTTSHDLNTWDEYPRNRQDPWYLYRFTSWIFHKCGMPKFENVSKIIMQQFWCPQGGLCPWNVLSCPPLGWQNPVTTCFRFSPSQFWSTQNKSQSCFSREKLGRCLEFWPFLWPLKTNTAAFRMCSWSPTHGFMP